MRVIITGGTGLIGRALADVLANDGHEIILLSRNPARVGPLPPGIRAEKWDAVTTDGWGHLADGAGAIVNLAGENLAGDGFLFLPARWTEERKQRIRQSRIDATRAVVTAVTAAREKPGVVVQASAAGYYGPQFGNEPLTESAPPGDDFLARLCIDWEAAATPIAAAGVRLAIARTGAVLNADEGAFPRLIIATRLLAGQLGRGGQWLPWIHLADAARALAYLIDNETMSGPVNVAAPNPVTNRQMMRAIGRTLSWPNLLPIPAFVVRLLVGEVATVVLDGQRLVPAALADAAFSFHYGEVDSAVRNLLGKGG